MPSYTFKVVGEVPAEIPDKDSLKQGDLIEVDMKMTEYDQFKADHVAWLERVIDAPAFVFGDTVKPPGKVMERLNHIKHHYPGAKDMFKNARFTPPREW